LIARRVPGRPSESPFAFPLHFDHVRAEATDDLTVHGGGVTLATQKKIQETASSS